MLEKKFGFRGVAGLLLKKMLASSRLESSSTSTERAATDLASNRVGWYFPSGSIRRIVFVSPEAARFFDVASSRDTLGLKYLLYSRCFLSASAEASDRYVSSAVMSMRLARWLSVAERWWLVAGRRNVGNFDPGSAEPDVARNEDDLLTSLFGGSGEGGRLPIIGAVEPSCENAIDPLDQECEGERGPGLDSRLEVVGDEENVDNRFAQDDLGRRGRAAPCDSAVASEAPATAMPSWVVSSSIWGTASPVVFLLSLRKLARVSWLRRAAGSV